MRRALAALALSAIIAAPALADRTSLTYAHGRGFHRDAFAPAGYDVFGNPRDYAGDAYPFHVHDGRFYDAFCFEAASDLAEIDGRPAVFAGVVCQDAHGHAWVLDGSRRFLGFAAPEPEPILFGGPDQIWD